ncbi:MAG: cation:dicarboxylase symporter family transporter [Acidobacteriaceae bacterium]|nr:cation:dicarboxylase symporter family transporter [Acidobacteriaceae bacterium]MBV9780470.1 cation:dicarboxylase symporter family transporter [Acidobacteriaceae bacterium]
MSFVRKISLTSWIFIGLVAGILTGVFFPEFSKHLSPISNIFLRLIRSIVGPLLFGTLVYGIASAGELKTMGRIALKALIYFEIATTLALVIGLLTVNIMRPGTGLRLAGGPAGASALANPVSLSQVLEHAVPSNIFESLAQNDVLEMVIFFFLFGAACSAIGAKAQPVVNFAASVAEVMFRYTKYAMYLAPFGVAAAIAVTIGSKGLGVLFGLGKLVGTLYLAQAVCVLVVLGASLVIARVPIGRFWQAARQPFLIAYSTASSEAALPLALENMERFGVPKHIVGFVLPTGYSFNLIGSTLYLSLASMFIAQAADMRMPLASQISMMLTLMLMSKGTAGVPRGALVVLAGALATFQLPPEGITLILGVDALMDMCRTSVNVLGNCVATAVVARWERVPFTRVGGEVEIAVAGS